MTTVAVPVPAKTVTVPAVSPPPLQVSITSPGEASVSGSLSVPEVTPPPVLVPAYTVSYAIQASDAVATLQAEGYTVTPPSVSPPVTPPVTPPPSGAIVIVDGNGQLGPQFGGSPTPSDVLYGTPGNPATALVGGNWNSNYIQTLGARAPDGSLAMQLTPNGPWPIWLPHGYAKAGNSTPNGILTQLAGKTELKLEIYVSQAVGAGVFTLGLAENLGAGSYVGPNAPTAEQMGPVTYNCPAFVVGWNSVNVTLAQLGLPWTIAPASTDPYGIYKLAMQQHSETGETIWVRDAEFV